MKKNKNLTYKKILFNKFRFNEPLFIVSLIKIKLYDIILDN